MLSVLERGFAWTAAIHQMQAEPNGDVTTLCRACQWCDPCPGLSNCTARLVLADGWRNTAALLPRRMAAAHDIHPGLPSRRRHAPRRPPSTRQVPPQRRSSAGPGRARERPKAGCRARGVSMGSRHDSGGCPQGLGRCLPGWLNQNRVVLFETPPPVSVLAPAPGGSRPRRPRQPLGHVRVFCPTDSRQRAKFAGRSTLYSILYTMRKTGNSIP